MQRRYAEKLCFFCALLFLPGKEFSFSQPLFILEAVIFTTEKKKKVNVRGKSPKSGDYRAAE